LRQLNIARFLARSSVTLSILLPNNNYFFTALFLVEI
jgi:hypothetical protein